MAFINQAVTVLQTLVIALGAGLAVWGVINLMEGYGNDNPAAKSQGIKQIVEKCTAGKQYQRADHHDVRVDIDNSGGMDIMLLLSDYDLECIDKQMS